jgi:hypothetical protein
MVAVAVAGRRKKEKLEWEVSAGRVALEKPTR